MRIALRILLLALFGHLASSEVFASPDKVQLLSARQVDPPFNPTEEAHTSLIVETAVRATDGLASESSYQAAKTRFYLNTTWVLARNGATIATMTKRTDIVPPFQFVDLPAGSGAGTKRFVRINTVLEWDGRSEDGACLADGSLDARVDVEFVREKDTGSGTKTKEIDRAGPASLNVSVLGTPPVLSISAPVNGFITREASVTVSGVVSTLLPTTVTVATQPVSATNGTFSTVLSLVEGATQITVSATDCAGRTTSRSIHVVRDSIPPTVRIESPEAGAFERTSTPAVRVSYADVGTGIAAGSVRIVISGVDRTTDFDVGATAATLKSGTALGLLDGAHQVVATVEDLAHNQAQATASFHVDTIAPAMSVEAPAAGTYVNTKSPPVRVSYSDAGSGVSTSTARIVVSGADRTSSFLITPSLATLKPDVDLALAEGPATIAATVEDRAGNSAQASSTFIVDTIAPDLTIVYPPPGFITSVSPIRVTGQVRDASPITKFHINGIPVTVTDGAFAVDVPLQEGPVTLTFCLADAAGNAALRVLKGTHDAHPPQITVLSPAEGAFFKTEPIDVSGAVFDATPVTVAVNGVAATVQNSSFTARVPLVHGSNVLDFVATDASGLTTSVQRTVVLDLEKPSITVASPANGSTVTTSTPEIVITYHNGHSGVDPATFHASIDGVDRTSAFTIGAAEARFALTAADKLIPGAHVITCRVSDRAGNESSASSLFEVITGPLPPPETPTSGVARGKVSDGFTDTPLSGVEVTIDGIEGTIVSRPDGTYDFPAVETGEYLMTLSKEGYTSAQRNIKIVKGRESAVKPAYLIPRSPPVAVKADVGGTVTDSTGRVTVEIPPGALPADADVQVTDLPGSKYLPNDLPPQSVYLSAFNFEPSTKFLVPIKVKYRLRTTVPMPAGTPIPIGRYDMHKGKWVHESMATVTSDGLHVEGQISESSTIDINPPAERPFPLASIKVTTTEGQEGQTDNGGWPNNGWPEALGGDIGELIRNAITALTQPPDG